MSKNLEPIIKPFDFWSLPDEGPDNFKIGTPEFFAIFIPKSDNVASFGWWDGEELLWLAEYYHAAGNEMVFYVLDSNSSVDECSREDWFQFVSNQTPECLPWILFRLPELNLL